MSQGNVEIVRRHIDAFLDDTTTSLSFLDPSVVLDRGRAGTPDSQVVHGHEAVVRTVRRHIGTFEEYAFEVEQLTDLGSGAVLALITATGRGKGIGVPVRRSLATLYTLIEGKIVRMTAFRSQEQALEAVAGPSE